MDNNCLMMRKFYQGFMPIESKDREKLGSLEGSLCVEKPVGSGFDIHEAFLYPPEVEQGLWPEDYSLSDHAPLTAIFRPYGACDV
jgi:hypothetical protein